MESVYQKTKSKVEFPKFKGGLLYMHKTMMNNVVMPKGYKHYTEAVKSALENVKDKNAVCYITIDEKTVCKETHRREGIHVDFNWFENLGGGKHGHKPIVMGGHNGSSGGHSGNGNSGSGGGGSHNGNGGGGHSGNGSGSKNNGNGGHNGSSPSTHCGLAEFNKNGGMLLVSNYEGCRVYRGKFKGEIGEGGDCAGIDISKLKGEVMKRNEVYFLNALAIHEPLIINEKVNRSLIRINFHPDYVWRNN